MSRQYKVAVAGATGAVGQQMVACLEERKFPVGELKPLASERSIGKTVTFQGKEIHVEVLNKDSFKGVDIALFSAGGSISKEYGPIAAQAGAVVVDNSSAWRMDPEVPLVVPEVNPQDIALYKKTGIIANPNCSTIQMVVVLKPLHDAARIKRVVVSTYQAVSGTGQKAVDELVTQVRALFTHQEVIKKVYPHRIAFNCLPHIDVFLDNGYTKEEMKMVNETRKIMGDDSYRGHGHHGAGAGVLRALRVGEPRNREKAHRGRGPQGPGEVPRGQGGGQPGQKRIPHADRRNGAGPDPGGAHPGGLHHQKRAEPVDRGRQHPQGRGHQRRADCGDID